MIPILGDDQQKGSAISADPLSEQEYNVATYAFLDSERHWALAQLAVGIFEANANSVASVSLFSVVNVI